MNRSKKPCQHPRWTVPIKMLIKAEDSQEIIGEALLQVCCDCGHTKGGHLERVRLQPLWEHPLHLPYRG